MQAGLDLIQWCTSLAHSTVFLQLLLHPKSLTTIPMERTTKKKCNAPQNSRIRTCRDKQNKKYTRSPSVHINCSTTYTTNGKKNKKKEKQAANLIAPNTRNRIPYFLWRILDNILCFLWGEDIKFVLNFLMSSPHKKHKMSPKIHHWKHGIHQIRVKFYIFTSQKPQDVTLNPSYGIQVVRESSESDCKLLGARTSQESTHPWPECSHFGAAWLLLWLPTLVGISVSLSHKLPAIDAATA